MACNQVLVEPILMASTWLQRMRGLFLRHGFNDVILITPCRAIHTWGMNCAIDVAFLDKRGFVLASYWGVKPWRFLKCRKACAVLERFTCEAAWFQPGERVVIAVMKEANYENLSCV